MNTMVAARVPVEVKEQGDGILKSLGSNPTDLINKAYLYVLKNHALPGDKPEAENKEGVRVVTAEMLKEFQKAYEEMSLPLADAWGQKNFEEIRQELEGERYARFA